MIQNKYLKRLVKLLFFLIAAAVFFFIFGRFYRCPISSVVAIPCPGCGMTRALLSAIKFNFTEAFRYHPLFFVVILGFIVAVVFYLKGDLKVLLNRKIAIPIALLFLLVYIIRMILYFPHTEPMVIDQNALVLRLWRFIF